MNLQAQGAEGAFVRATARLGKQIASRCDARLTKRL